MADSINREDGMVKIIKDGHIVHEYSDGIISGFGAGDITYQIRGESH
jgi:UDP-N-acetylmuramate--alanine ligase